MHYTTNYDGEPHRWREAAEIAEELSALRTHVAAAEEKMKLLEARKEDLILALSESESYRDGEKLHALAAVCEECESLRLSLLALSEQAEALNEELEDALWWIRGTLTVGI